MSTKYKLLIVLFVFLCAYFIPFKNIKIQNAIMEAFYMIQDYAQKHVLLCLVPAFFIAGAISIFVSQESVMKYLGADANKFIAYSVSSISGTILAVCSCTVLPLFAGIYKMGAGLGPACSFLYSGPAINVLAIVLTAKVLGWQIGLARVLGAILFAFVIGILMSLTFKNEVNEKKRMQSFTSTEIKTKRTLFQDALYFFSMVGVLVFANWAKPDADNSIWFTIYNIKWYLTALFAIIFAFVFVKYFKAKLTPIILTIILVIISSILFPEWHLLSFSIGIAGLIYTVKISNEETKNWLEATTNFSLQILPLLFFGVIAAGFLLGMPGSNNGIIPYNWISKFVGGNSLLANFFSAIIGAFMYFATLTEIPILQSLLGAGMGKGPALALLLAGPALSLPNMLVINSILGFKKTFFYIFYVVILSTFIGYIFGFIA